MLNNKTRKKSNIYLTTGFTKLKKKNNAKDIYLVKM